MTSEQELARKTRIAAFIKNAKLESWSTESQLKLILAELRHFFPEIADDAHKAKRLEFFESLEKNGMGGNSSAFGKWLAHKDQGLIKPPLSVETRHNDI